MTTYKHASIQRAHTPQQHTFHTKKYQKQTSLDTEQISSIYIPITISKNKTRLIYQLNPNWALNTLQAIIVVQKHETSISLERYQFSEPNKSGFTQKGFTVNFLWIF
jgi:hypothetical protein